MAYLELGWPVKGANTGGLKKWFQRPMWVVAQAYEPRTFCGFQYQEEWTVARPAVWLRNALKIYVQFHTFSEDGLEGLLHL